MRIKGIRARSPILLLVLLLFSATGSADMFLKIPSIPGESTDSEHKDWIDILSVSTAIHHPAPIEPDMIAATSGGIIVTKRIDKATPLLMEATSTGNPLRAAGLNVTRLAGDGTKPVYFQWVLKDVIITSTIAGGDSFGGETELVSLAYSRADWYYRLFDPDGTLTEEVSAFWDVQTNETGQGTGNNPPTIEQVAQQSVQPGEFREVSLSIFDPDTPVDTLTVEALTPDGDLIKGLSVTGDGSDRTLSFTASALNSGVGTIEVSVSDGEHIAWIAFSVLIDVDMTPFEAFLAAYFTEEERMDQDLVSPIGDPDFDDIPTIIEFMLGGNPRVRTLPEEILEVRREELREGPVITINFRRRTDELNIRVTPWMAPESLDTKEYKKLVQGGNPLYEESSTGGENPLYDDVEGTVTVDPGVEAYFIRLQVVME